ncbi:MAG: chromate transporter [Clostridia bacterium]|nr:chromate transporter [Clostridia bacterium]
MIFLRLFLEFFKIGLFAVGGGMATLPFLYRLSEATGWFSPEALADMVAVSESTPGPIGVNMATYVGFTSGSQSSLGFFGSLLGALVATLGLITPSVIIIIIIAGFLKKFSENRFVTSAFYGIRPAAVAMVLSALLLLSRTVFLNLPQNIADFSLAGSVNWIAVGLGLLVFLLTTRLKKVHPIAFIALGAVAGILFGL